MPITAMQYPSCRGIFSLGALILALSLCVFCISGSICAKDNRRRWPNSDVGRIGPRLARLQRIIGEKSGFVSPVVKYRAAIRSADACSAEAGLKFCENSKASTSRCASCRHHPGGLASSDDEGGGFPRGLMAISITRWLTGETEMSSQPQQGEGFAKC